MGAIQGSINQIIGSVAATAVAGKKMADEQEAKAEKITSTQTSLHIANERVSQDESALEEANKSFEELNQSERTTKNGRTQVIDNNTKRIVKRYDYDKAQTAIKTAVEQIKLSEAIRDSYKRRLEVLTGGNK